MAGVGGGEADEERKRRLPSWMVGPTVDKSDTGDHRGANSNSNSNSIETSDFPVKSETKTRRRTKSAQHQQEEDDINIPRKKRKVREPAPLKPKKLKEIQTSSPDETQDDDGEELTLTVEDLLSIAKEYVQEADSQRHSPNRDFDSEKQLPVPASSSEQSLLSVNKTGDPAQDMLDLFLGPWLKKPVEEQNRTKS